MTERVGATDAPPPPPPPPPDDGPRDRTPEVSPELARAIDQDGQNQDGHAQDGQGRAGEPDSARRPDEVREAEPDRGTPDLPEPDASAELRSAVTDSPSPDGQDGGTADVPAQSDGDHAGPPGYHRPDLQPADTVEPGRTPAGELQEDKLPRDPAAPDRNVEADSPGTAGDEPGETGDELRQESGLPQPDEAGWPQPEPDRDGQPGQMTGDERDPEQPDAIPDDSVPRMTNSPDEDQLADAGEKNATDEGTGTDRPPSGWDDEAVADHPSRPDPDSIRIPPDRATHILDGEERNGRFAGGHRSGTGIKDKTEFPADWDDDRILSNVEDIARNPDSAPKHQPHPDGDRWRAEGVRDGVHVTVIVGQDGTVVTAWPREGDPGVVKNS